MKRCFFAVLFLFCSMVCYGQRDSEVAGYIALLDRPVAKHFHYLSHERYSNVLRNIDLFTENNVVKYCCVSKVFATDKAGEVWIAAYHSYFKRHGWEYTDSSWTYVKNGVHASLPIGPYPYDGSFISWVAFTKDAEWFTPQRFDKVPPPP